MASGLSLNIDTTKSEFQNPMVELRQGDGNYQSLRVTVTSNGEPLLLDGWTINFMGTTAGGHKIVDSDTHVINASNGVFDYTPTKAWGQDIGEFDKAYFKFTNGDEAASGANFRVKVFEAVDLTDEEAGDYISVVDVMIDKIKTDMDNKLADTQTTLTETQNQANTVQSNVNDLNTNVNELKTQNLSIKTSDNRWTGTNGFMKPVYGSLATQTDLFTSFATVAKNMQTYAGYSFSGTGYITDMPVAGYATILVQPKENSNNTGYISLVYSNIKLSIIGHVNMGAISWEILANDETAVHKTGTENIDGIKRFMQPIYGSLATNVDLFTSFSEVAKNMIKYAGYTSSGTGYITDMPYHGYALINVQPFSGKNDTGIITLEYSNVPITIVGHVNSGVITWVFVSNDATVVHNIGTETVAGDKTFTGNNKFTGHNSFNGVNVMEQSNTVEFSMWYGSKMKATRFGNMVSLAYSQSPSQDIPSGVTSQETIPLGFRPSFDWYMTQGGVSTSGSSAVKVTKNGNLSVSGTVSVAYPYTMTAMYFTADPFPS